MPAETFNCPMCGAAASKDSSRCEHCGARLATVSCPECFALQFQGAAFCSHCGAKLDRTEMDAASSRLCPRCRAPMQAVTLGRTSLCECPRCEGLWADHAALEQICADREQQAAVLGAAVPAPPSQPVDLEEQIRYLPCPICRGLMNRVNFAHCSHVVVDVCRPHGTWFDKDELRRIVEFIRAGGLDAARTREIEELEQRRRELTAARSAGGCTAGDGGSGFGRDDMHFGISAVGAVLKALLGR